MPVTINDPTTKANTIQSIRTYPSIIYTEVGKSQILQVEAKYRNGQTEHLYQGLPQYSSSDTSIVTINDYGEYWGISEGTATITVTYVGKTIKVPVKVGPVVTESMGMLPYGIDVKMGGTTQLMIIARMSDGSAHIVTNTATYSIGNEAIAKVSKTGVITGLSQARQA